MKREKEEIAVLVRATPERSKRNGDGYDVGVTVINKDGELLRLYPFRFSYGEGLVDFREMTCLRLQLPGPRMTSDWKAGKSLTTSTWKGMQRTEK